MLDIRDIHFSYDGGEPVLAGIDMEIEQGEILCLLGASGSGKSTLLRIVAGLETSYSGTVFFDGESVDRVPSHRRNFGLMFQEFALFPHMNVAENVGFGPRMRGVQSRSARKKQIEEILSLVGLHGFDQRDVAELSGGERQRVALARSLAAEPRLLMLDEPLGSLDAALRDRLAVELRDIIKRLELTSIYVTHDQAEAYAIADRVAVIHRGRIEQVDTPRQIYRYPRTEYVARFLGLMNIIPIEGLEGDMARTPLGSFSVSGKPDSLLLHPDGLKLVSEEQAVSGTISACVLSRVFRGQYDHLRVDAGHGITLSLTISSRAPSLPEVGETAYLDVAPDAVLGLRRSGNPTD